MKVWTIDTRNATRTTLPSAMNRQGMGVDGGGASSTLTQLFVPGVAICGFDSYNNELTGGVSNTLRTPSGGDNIAKVIERRMN